MMQETIIQTQINAGARLWIYQADRKLKQNELLLVNDQLGQFLNQWNTHGKPLVADAFLKYDVFLILAVDESQQYASGCSIDSSVHFVKNIGAQIGIDFFNRLKFTYLKENEVQFIDSGSMKEAFDKGIITQETLFFDNLIKNVGELEHWMKPLAQSWHYRFI